MDKLKRVDSFIIVASHIKAYAVILVLGIPAETWSCGLFTAGVIFNSGGFYPGFPGGYPEIVIIFFVYPGKGDLAPRVGAYFSLDRGRVFGQAIGTGIGFTVITADVCSKLFDEILILFNEFYFPGRHFYWHDGILSGG